MMKSTAQPQDKIRPSQSGAAKSTKPRNKKPIESNQEVLTQSIAHDAVLVGKASTHLIDEKVIATDIQFDTQTTDDQYGFQSPTTKLMVSKTANQADGELRKLRSEGLLNTGGWQTKMRRKRLLLMTTTMVVADFGQLMVGGRWDC